MSISWDKQPLGQVTDQKIAETLNVPTYWVQDARQKRDIPPYCPPQLDWDAQPLGEISDKALANQLNALPARVRFERIRRSIPPYRQCKIKNIDWKSIFPTKKSDARLAQELDCAISTVKRKRKKASIDWDTQPLGQMPDKDLAVELKINYHIVRQERISRDIQPYGLTFDRLDWDTLLTGEPDAVIAERIGCSGSTVWVARTKRGQINDTVERHINNQLRTSQIDWDAQDLGSRSDLEIAAELEVQPNIVRKQRNARLILSAAEQRRQELKPLLEQSDLGVESDAFIAEKLGTSREKVGGFRRAKGIDSLLGPKPNNGHKGIDWDNQPLGLMTDEVLAKILGVGHSAVSNQRLSRSITAFRHTDNFTPTSRKKNIDWDKQPLGEIPDTQLARKLGVVAGTIRYARLKRGIPTAKRGL